MYFPNISSQIQDPLVLLDPVSLTETLLEWLPVLERILGPAQHTATAAVDSGEERWDREYLNPCSEQTENFREEEDKEQSGELRGEEVQCDSAGKELKGSNGGPPEPFRVVSPKPLQLDLLANLTQLATLYTELSCFRKPESGQALGCTTFLQRYFFLLDTERVRRMCLLCYQEQPEVQSSFTEAMLGQEILHQPPEHVTSVFLCPSYISDRYRNEMKTRLFNKKE